MLYNKIFVPIALCSASLSLSSTAAVVTLDVPNALAQQTSHQGNVIVSISDFTTPADIRISIIGPSGLLPQMGATSDISFTQGASLVVDVSSAGFSYIDMGVFTSGAQPGLNYARFDLDNNGVFETVFEFDFGTDESFVPTDLDVITRYAYDDNGANLDIPEAVTALNAVPEPASALLVFCSALSLIRRKR